VLALSTVVVDCFPGAYQPSKRRASEAENGRWMRDGIFVGGVVDLANPFRRRVDEGRTPCSKLSYQHPHRIPNSSSKRLRAGHSRLIKPGVVLIKVMGYELWVACSSLSQSSPVI